MRDMNKCQCGCGTLVRNRFVSGHNLKTQKKTDAHRRRIAEGQRRAWATTRKRAPEGSTHTSADGYVIEKRIRSDVVKWLPQHRLVMEEAIGRPLTRREVVHHIDGDRSNNSLENLHLCSSRSEHNRVHNSQDAALRTLMRVGLVRFEGGRYEAVLP